MFFLRLLVALWGLWHAASDNMGVVRNLKAGFYYIPGVIGMQPSYGHFDPFGDDFHPIYEKDLELIQHTKADFVRIPGKLVYPYKDAKHLKFLDTALSRGIKVIPSFSFEEYQSEKWADAAPTIQQDFQEFMASFNHPAVIAWCLGDIDDRLSDPKSLGPIIADMIRKAKADFPAIPVAGQIFTETSASIDLRALFLKLDFNFLILDASKSTLQDLEATFEAGYPGGNKTALLQFSVSVGNETDSEDTQARIVSETWTFLKTYREQHNNTLLAPLFMEWTDQWWRSFETNCDASSMYFQDITCGLTKDTVAPGEPGSFDAVQSNGFTSQFNSWGQHCTRMRKVMNVFVNFTDASPFDDGQFKCAVMINFPSLRTADKLVWYGIAALALIGSICVRVGVEPKPKKDPDKLFEKATPKEMLDLTEEKKCEHQWVDPSKYFSGDWIELHAQAQRIHVQLVFQNERLKLQQRIPAVDDLELEAWNTTTEKFLASYFLWRGDDPILEKKWKEETPEKLKLFCVTYRTMISLAEDGIHAPSQINLCFLACEKAWNPHLIMGSILHNGLDEMSQKWEARRTRCCFSSRVNFDDMEDSGKAEMPRAKRGQVESFKVKRFFLENTGIFVLVDLLIHFRSIFYVKVWIFALAYYLSLEVKSGHIFFLGYNYWESILVFDALIFVFCEVLVMIFEALQTFVDCRTCCGGNSFSSALDFFLRNVVPVSAAVVLLVMCSAAPSEVFILVRFGIFFALEALRGLRHSVLPPWHAYKHHGPGEKSLPRVGFWILVFATSGVLEYFICWGVSGINWERLCFPRLCFEGCEKMLIFCSNQCVACSMGIWFANVLVILGSLWDTQLVYNALLIILGYGLGHQEKHHTMDVFSGVLPCDEKMIQKRITLQFLRQKPSKEERKQQRQRNESDEKKESLLANQQSEENEPPPPNKKEKDSSLVIWKAVVDDLYTRHLIDESTKRKLIFEEDGALQVLHENREARDRLLFFINSLAHTSFFTPKLPRLTMSITAYSEMVLLSEAQLKIELPKIIARYGDEWKNFVAQTETNIGKPNGAKYTSVEFQDGFIQGSFHNHPKIILAIRLWASYRLQTVGRTIRGCVNYFKALDLFHQLQLECVPPPPEADHISTAPTRTPGPPSGGFAASPSLDALPFYFQREHGELLVAHQIYGTFPQASHKRSKAQIEEWLNQVESMDIIFAQFSRYSKCMLLVFDYEHVKENQLVEDERVRKRWVTLVGQLESRLGKFENKHPERSLYFSVASQFVDGEMHVQQAVPRAFPVLLAHKDKKTKTQGKAANQVNMLHFATGEIIQVNDANMDLWLGEALKVPGVCQLFFEEKKKRPVIVGFREYVYTRTTGATGMHMGDSEFAFGTITNRALLALGSRLHYGHPDFIDLLWGLGNGGLSKGSPIINTSEDVFAGFNVMNRNERIACTDIIEWQKGREESFLLASDFISKICAGFAGMQHSRDFRRLMDRKSFVGQLGLYFGAAGFYVNNFLVNLSMFTYMMTFLMLTLGGVPLKVIGSGGSVLGSEWIITTGIVSIFPLLFETMLEYGIFPALKSVILKGFLRPQSSFVFHAFQNKVAASALTRAAFTGQAGWIDTGRKPFYHYFGKHEAYIYYASSVYGSAFKLILLFTLYKKFESGGSHPMYMPVITAVVWFLAPVIFTPNLDNKETFLGDLKKTGRWLGGNIQTPFAARGEKRESSFIAFWTSSEHITTEIFEFWENVLAFLIYCLVAVVFIATSFASITDRLFLYFPMMVIYFPFTLTWMHYGGPFITFLYLVLPFVWVILCSVFSPFETGQWWLSLMVMLFFGTALQRLVLVIFSPFPRLSEWVYRLVFFWSLKFHFELILAFAVLGSQSLLHVLCGVLVRVYHLLADVLDQKQATIVPVDEPESESKLEPFNVA